MKENNLLHILVVEDNLGDFILLQEYLEMTQLAIDNIVRAQGMADVNSIINTNNNINLVLLDLTLPDSTGINSVISVNKVLPQTPIIVLSGLSNIHIATEAITLGAQDYLVKGEYDYKMLEKTIHYSIERKKIMENLRESNERYELIHKATQDTIWEWDFKTQKGRWGMGIINNFGYTEQVLTYEGHWKKDHLHWEDRERVLQKLKHCLESKTENWEETYRFQCADSSYKYVYDRGFIVYDTTGNPLKIVGSMTDVTERTLLEQQLNEQKITQQKIITETIIDTQEKERHELGKELHDNINQLLTSAKIFLGMARKKEDEKKEELLLSAYEIINDAINEIRTLSHSLVPPSLADFGLHNALNTLISRMYIGDGVKVELLYEIDEQNKIDAKKELMLYRIVQEQLNNVHKYAKAKNVTITLSEKEGIIFLTVTDDGVGFDMAEKKNGIGLKNIRSRVEFYNGKMQIVSLPGEGCTLKINIQNGASTEF